MGEGMVGSRVGVGVIRHETNEVRLGCSGHGSILLGLTMES